MTTQFGPWSTTLGIGLLFGCTVAAALLAQRRNRAVNSWLAGLLIVVSMKLLPYILGYAGYYDAYPGLSFAPFSLGFAFDLLLWLYVQRLTLAALPPRWAWHLLPTALQLLYGLICFAQPLAWKNAWDTAVHAPFIDPLETWGAMVSLALYLRLAWRRRRAYELWVDQQLSNPEAHRFTGLRNILAAMAVLLLFSGAFELLSAWQHFNYFQRFPLYLGLTALVYALGLEAWRQADRVHPAQVEVAAAVPVLVAQRDGTDWAAQGRLWRERTETGGWWRDPDLSLDKLARHLGTNSGYLSRAFNEGLGLSFSAVIGELRVAWVCQQIDAGANKSADLLSLGLQAGFSAKTSFNRVFKLTTGLTPSAYRASKAGANA